MVGGNTRRVVGLCFVGTFFVALGAGQTAAQTQIWPALLDLEELTSPGSEGGAAITEQEAWEYASQMASYGYEECIDAIAVAYAYRHHGYTFEGGAYDTIVSNLRYQVEGLAIGHREAPGVSFLTGPKAQGVGIHFDPEGVGYTAVDVVYTSDAWLTAQAASLEATAGGWVAQLDTPPTGRLEYALHLFGPDGQDFWLNNGRDLGVYQGAYWLNFGLDLESTYHRPRDEEPPALQRLLIAYLHPWSVEGPVVSMAELSSLVEQLTWEGGHGIHAWGRLNDLLELIGSMDQAGLMEAGAGDAFTGFVEAQRDQFHHATYPGASWQRGPEGVLWMDLQDDYASSAEIYYSTDGWSTAHSTWCTRWEPEGGLRCQLGHFPPGTMLTYTFVLRYPDGGEVWHHVAGDLNFVHEVPL